ncbi:MFS transporter [Ahrensia sp. R2A130]|uniref:spinster family MFS transporter n=1 Tax=Ahrensia sp. R2A130 TaxID=744979 RepID=UPI0001E0D0D7|nr:MFS transporter [Ahrensia sp. R2A130]EFL89416.1 major facilitator transporter [Ahrensia sp. R2A130]
MAEKDPHSRSLLLLLTSAFALNHLDRHILNITLNDIGLEFQLSDLQLGTLSGFAFAIVYVVLGFPVAKLSRPGRRKLIVTSALGIWSVMTLLVGASANYLQIFLARVGVGIGEAGFVPPSHSMIADAYEKDRRASAIAFFSAGANVGIFLSFIIGGFVAGHYGWRAAFLVAGLPGLFLMVVMLLKLKEPKTAINAENRKFDQTEIDSYRIVLKKLLELRSTRHVLVAATLTSVVGYGAIAWIAVFLTRIHELPLPQTGLYLAIVVGLAGAIGTWLGGKFSDKLGKTRSDWRLKFVAITILIAKPLAILFYLNEHLAMALTLFVIPAATGSIFIGPTFAHAYARVLPHQRAQVTALLMFTLNLVGLGVGPILIGFISDTLSASYGADSLRYALIAIQLAGLWAAVHFWLAGRAVLVEEDKSVSETKEA